METCWGTEALATPASPRLGSQSLSHAEKGLGPHAPCLGNSASPAGHSLSGLLNAACLGGGMRWKHV